MDSVKLNVENAELIENIRLLKKQSDELTKQKNKLDKNVTLVVAELTKTKDENKLKESELKRVSEEIREKTDRINLLDQNLSQALTHINTFEKSNLDDLKQIKNENINPNNKGLVNAINIERDHLNNYLIHNKIQIEKSEIEYLLKILKRPIVIAALKSVKANISLDSYKLINELLEHGVVLDTTSILGGTIGYELSPLGEALLGYISSRNNYALGA